MRRYGATLAFFLMVLMGTSQIAPEKYFVEFTNKGNSQYSLDKPWEFLTQRALDRRASAGVPVIENDLPVNSGYVEEVRNIGVQVITRSRWFNGITIFTPDLAKIAQIEMLPFVTKVVKGGVKVTKPESSKDKFELEQGSIIPLISPYGIPLKSADSYDYGISYTQVHMVRTDQLHDLGFNGDGMVIAVLDAGFNLVDQLAPFDSLWENNQILGTRDFVNPGGNVFIGHTHGMSVLSIMGGNVPGQLIGTAPKADYWLLRSEDAGTEFLIEEYNWVSAAEFADSIGADIINSSLGYTVFDDSTQNHTCADMTGNTTPVTRGANIAFSKGILVVNSAGNEGNKPGWQCVSAPSDGTNVMAIAAVDSLGQYASFSSKGVVNGSYVKPNVAAMGKLTVLSGGDGTVSRSNGTSFSSPVIAGSSACLWQAFPGFSNGTIKMAIEESAQHYGNPDILLGYGIPNFFKAYERLTGIDPNHQTGSMIVFPNPSSGHAPVTFRLSTREFQTIRVQVVDVTGRQVYSRDQIPCVPGENLISLTDLRSLKSGIYILKVKSLDGPAFSETARIQKLNF